MERHEPHCLKKRHQAPWSRGNEQNLINIINSHTRLVACSDVCIEYFNSNIPRPDMTGANDLKTSRKKKLAPGSPESFDTPTDNLQGCH